MADWMVAPASTSLARILIIDDLLIEWPPSPEVCHARPLEPRDGVTSRPRDGVIRVTSRC